MFARRQLNQLAERKRLLAMEAELHRSLIGLGREELGSRLAGVQAMREQVFAKKPLLLVGAGLAGLLAMRDWRKVVRWAPAVLTAWRWMRALRR